MQGPLKGVCILRLVAQGSCPSAGGTEGPTPGSAGRLRAPGPPLVSPSVSAMVTHTALPSTSLEGTSYPTSQTVSFRRPSVDLPRSHTLAQASPRASREAAPFFLGGQRSRGPVTTPHRCCSCPCYLPSGRLVPCVPCQPWSLAAGQPCRCQAGALCSCGGLTPWWHQNLGMVRSPSG